MKPEAPPLDPIEEQAKEPEKHLEEKKPASKMAIWGPPVPKSIVEEQIPPDTFFDSDICLGIALSLAILIVIVLFGWK